MAIAPLDWPSGPAFLPPHAWIDATTLHAQLIGVGLFLIAGQLCACALLVLAKSGLIPTPDGGAIWRAAPWSGII